MFDPVLVVGSSESGVDLETETVGVDSLQGSYMKLMTEVQSSSSRGTAATDQRHLSSEFYFISVLNSSYYELTMVWYMSWYHFFCFEIDI